MVTPRQLVTAAKDAGLDLIAICDHDTMRNAAEVRDRGAEIGLGVVMGQEITTRFPAKTHCMGWFLEKPVRSSMSLEDTVDAIHDQGGLAVIPHPFMPTYFASCQRGMLESLIEHRRVDGIEVRHTAPMTAGRQRELEAFYAQHREQVGAAIGSSDSHFGRYDIGRAVTRFEGNTVADFCRAVEAGTTQAARGQPKRVPLDQMALQQWRSLVLLPLRRVTQTPDRPP